MPIQLLNLRGVPDDEADEIRELLTEHGIAYYETPPNRWGITMGAIWLKREDQVEQARELLGDYQADRLARAQAEYEAQKRQGTADGLVSLFMRHPLRYLLYLIGIAVVLYLSIAPFLGLGQY